MGASTGINFIRHITSFSPSFVASPPSLSVLPWSSPTLILPLIVHIRFPSGVTHCCCCCRCRQDHRHHYHHRHQRQHHAYNYHRQCNGQYHQLPSPNPSINTTRHPFSGKLCQNTTEIPFVFINHIHVLCVGVHLSRAMFNFLLEVRAWKQRWPWPVLAHTLWICIVAGTVWYCAGSGLYSIFGLCDCADFVHTVVPELSLLDRHFSTLKFSQAVQHKTHGHAVMPRSKNSNSDVCSWQFGRMNFACSGRCRAAG